MDITKISDQGIVELYSSWNYVVYTLVYQYSLTILSKYLAIFNKVSS